MHRTPVLIALAALAAALGIAVAIDCLGGAGPELRVPRQILPELARDQVVAIEIERAGEAPVRLERSGGGFALTAPIAAPAEPAAVRDLLGTLELLAFRRQMEGRAARDPARGLDPPRATVRVEQDGRPALVLHVGADVAEARGAWVRRGDREPVYLVESHAARTLLRPLDDLRQRRVWRSDPERAERIEIVARGGEDEDGGELSLVATGLPRRVELRGLGSARMDPARAGELERLVGGLAFRRFAEPAPDASAPGIRIALVAAGRSEELEELGPCPGEAAGEASGDAGGEAALALVRAPAGTGCVALADLRALEELARAGDALADRRLLGDRPVARAAIATGDERIELSVDGETGEAVREWLAEVAAAAVEPVPRAAAERAARFGAFELEYRDGGAEALELRRDRAGRLFALPAGPDEAALALSPEAASLLRAEPWRFRSRILHAADWTELSEATAARGEAAGERIVRGELLDDWSAAAPAGASLAAGAIDDLRAAVAPLRALGTRAARARAEHRLDPPRRVVDLVFDPPAGSSDPRRLRLEIGAATAGGCHVRLAGDPAVHELAEPRCAALLGPWTDP